MKLTNVTGGTCCEVYAAPAFSTNTQVNDVAKGRPAMGSPIRQVTARCTRAYHTVRWSSGDLFTPSLAGWILGWLSAEFAPHVLTGHAMSAIPAAQLTDRLRPCHAEGRPGLDTALRGAFGERYEDAVYHPLEPYTAKRPHVSRVLDAMLHRRKYVSTTSNISYGSKGRHNLLDVWRRPDLPEGGRAPVLIRVPGGAWAVNDKRGQAYPLMTRMTQLGWICVSINHRRSRAPRMAHIVDVKRAIAWVRKYCGLRRRPRLHRDHRWLGGGHLSSLAALTSGDTTLQPGFEDADTSVQAAVPLLRHVRLHQHRQHARPGDAAA